MRARLYEARLEYAGGLVVHTAASGPTPFLHELYLVLEDDGAEGFGEVRVNIAYLNGLPPERVVAEAVAALAMMPRGLSAADLLRTLPIWAGVRSAPVRMLLDVALHDLLAREAGTSVAALLGGAADAVACATNQTLFWTDETEFLARAECYVGRGFRDLKVRLGVGTPAEDISRVTALRERFGEAVTIAVDANGAWSRAAAPGILARLGELGVAYAEQPLPPGDFGALLALAERSPVPIMLDESVASAADVERIAAVGGKLWAHLKLVKLGGIGPTVAAARKLAVAGVPFMLGQMNEGAGATAAALQVALATGPRFAELYGADGLVDDPVAGLHYADGEVMAGLPLGLGVGFDPARARLIEEFRE